LISNYFVKSLFSSINFKNYKIEEIQIKVKPTNVYSTALKIYSKNILSKTISKFNPTRAN